MTNISVTFQVEANVNEMYYANKVGIPKELPAPSFNAWMDSPNASLILENEVYRNW